MARFTDKTVLITGGTRGIGLAGARRVVEEGGRVIVTGLNHLEAARQVLGRSATVLRCDGNAPQSAESLFESLSDIGHLDGLWLNAGFAQVGPLEALTAQSFDAIMAVNVRAPALQMARLSPLLRAGASVVVTSSSSAYEAAPLVSAYAASKGAMVSMARCWAAALAARGIRVNTLIPGPIETAFRDFMGPEGKRAFERMVVDKVPLGRPGTSEEAAAVALFLLSDDSGYVTGSQYPVDGGLLMR